MIINKITYGFVVQSWDTEQKKFTAQEFVGSDDREWEYGYGELDKPDADETQDPLDAVTNDGADEEPYLNFDMVQPS